MLTVNLKFNKMKSKKRFKLDLVIRNHFLKLTLMMEPNFLTLGPPLVENERGYRRIIIVNINFF